MTERSFISVVIFYDRFRFGGLCINEFIRRDELGNDGERSASFSNSRFEGHRVLHFYNGSDK